MSEVCKYVILQMIGGQPYIACFRRGNVSGVRGMLICYSSRDLGIKNILHALEGGGGKGNASAV